MPKVILDMSMSLDGYIGGRNYGDGLHDWVFAGKVPLEIAGTTFQMASDTSAKMFREYVNGAGAFIMGRVTYSGLSDNPAFGKPSFVLTHEARTLHHQQGTTITFVTEGVESALRQAQAAAGDKHVHVFGGASVAQQYLRAGLVDEIHINLIPKLIGGGLRLFEDNTPEVVDMECTSMIKADGVTHLQFRIVK